MTIRLFLSLLFIVNAAGSGMSGIIASCLRAADAAVAAKPTVLQVSSLCSLPVDIMKAMAGKTSPAAPHPLPPTKSPRDRSTDLSMVPGGHDLRAPAGLPLDGPADTEVLSLTGHLPVPRSSHHPPGGSPGLTLLLLLSFFIVLPRSGLCDGTVNLRLARYCPAYVR